MNILIRPESPRTLKLVQGGLEKGENLRVASTDCPENRPQGETPGTTKVIPSPGLLLQTHIPLGYDELAPIGVDAYSSSDLEEDAQATRRVMFEDNPVIFACPMDRESRKARKRSSVIERNLANFELIEKQLQLIDEEIALEESLGSKNRKNPIVRMKNRLLSMIA